MAIPRFLFVAFVCAAALIGIYLALFVGSVMFWLLDVLFMDKSGTHFWYSVVSGLSHLSWLIP